MIKIQINSQSLEDTQVGYILQKKHFGKLHFGSKKLGDGDDLLGDGVNLLGDDPKIGGATEYTNWREGVAFVGLG